MLLYSREEAGAHCYLKDQLPLELIGKLARLNVILEI